MEDLDQEDIHFVLDRTQTARIVNRTLSDPHGSAHNVSDVAHFKSARLGQPLTVTADLNLNSSVGYS